MKTKEVQDQPTYEAFLGSLRSALHYLYDPVHLRRSSLVSIMGLEKEFDQGAAVQRLLTRMIQSLKPAVEEPPQSVAWRIYDILNLLYVRQFPREIVANQLGISERQLRREQRQALEALAQISWEKASRPNIRPKETEVPPAATIPIEDQVLKVELDWLETPKTEQRIPLGETLETVAMLACPLANKMQAKLSLHVEPDLVELPFQQHAVRHILLTLLSVMLPSAVGGSVAILAARKEKVVEIRVAAYPMKPRQIEGSEDRKMDIVRQLAVFYGVQFQAGNEEVLLVFPAPQQATVMIIDDNADWLEMLKRFATGNRYQIIGVSSSKTACNLVREIQPDVIFLDVMMPGVDGWQILSELLNQQTGRVIPIVVCSVLPLEDLALSLGSSAFLQKPVTQDQFLGLLEKLTGNLPSWPQTPLSAPPNMTMEGKRKESCGI